MNSRNAHSPSATPAAPTAIDALPALKQNQGLDGGLIAGIGVIAGFAALAMLLGASLFIIKLCRGPRWKVPLWEDEILNLQTQTIYNHCCLFSTLSSVCVLAAALFGSSSNEE